MKIITAFAVGLALTAALPAVSAQAQNLRSFVSGHGSDSNNCTLATPCRTFQAAFNVTNAGGEIAVLDSAGYGGLTINKAISIVNPGGVEGGIIVPSGGTGIVINAGASDAVSLRGLTIEGGGVGANGIVFNTGKSLTILNSVVQNLTSVGINFSPNQSNASRLTVKDTFVASNGSDGIVVFPFIGFGAVTAVFNRVETDNNLNGIDLVTGTGGTVTATASDCITTGNSSDGFRVFSAGLVSLRLMLVSSVAANNGTGIEAFGAGTFIRVGLTTVTGNANGWTTATAAVLQSYGDNKINGNSANETSPPTIVGGGK